MRANPAWAEIDRLLEGAVDDGVFPGAVLLVGRGGEVLVESAVGMLGLGPGDRPTSPDTIYDLASLTKPLVTTTCLLLEIQRGRLALEDSVAAHSPRFAAAVDFEERSAVTLRQLLAHASGLPAHRRYFEQAGQAALVGEARAEVLALAAAEPLEAPPGQAAVYSDVGFIVLGHLIEESAGRSLDDLAERDVFAPLGAETAGFVTAGGPAEWPERTAPTGLCNWRGRVTHATVQDENAYAMGGVAGHAGLFGTARDVHLIAAEYVAASAGKGRLLEAGSVGECWRRQEIVAGSTWALGWDTPTPGGSSAGRLVSDDAVGHLGFTGTSLWVDRRRGVHVVLLTNRVHPKADDDRIRELRPRLHDAVFRTLDAGGNRAR